MTNKQEYNAMCLKCTNLGGECSGTRAKVWTDCILRNKPADEVRDYIDAMDKHFAEEGTR